MLAFHRHQLALVLLLLGGNTTAAIYTVGTGAGCTHATIQQAIDAAQANPGADTVRVTRSLSYTQQALTINTNQHLNLVGGFATCAQAATDELKTTISGAGGTLAPVFNITGQTGSIIKLRHLTITGGDTAGGNHGGGIHFVGNGELELIETSVSNNVAGYGGGLYADGTGPQALLRLSSDVLVAGNTARYSGGGIYLNNMNLIMQAPGSVLFNNTAQGLSGSGYGGGLIIRASARDARALIGSNGIGSLGAIAGNTARYGGGVAVVAEDDGVVARLELFGTDAARRTSIRDNLASVVGGGIYARPFYGFNGVGYARASIWNADLLLNEAPDGAAVYLEDDSFLGFAQGGELRINSWYATGHGLEGPPAGTVACPVGGHCGRIADNRSRDANSQPTSGAVIRANRNADVLVFQRPPCCPPTNGGVVFTNNTAGRLIDVVDNNDLSWVFLRNAAIHGNTLSQQLLRATGGGSMVTIENSTIAGNGIGAAQVLSVQGNFNLLGGLIWQPGKTALSHSGGTRTVNWSLANESVSLGGGPGAVSVQGPRFIDPARGDFRLRAASPAVDYVPSTTDSIRDADSRPRDVALLFDGLAARIRDAGAYERQSIDPLVLFGNFDVAGDLTLWPEITLGGSSWDSSQNVVGGSGSGSILVNQSNLIQRRFSARRQCIHLPLPGRYALNGWGRSNVGVGGTSDTVLLHWELRHSGGENCNDGPPVASGDHFLSSSSTWNQPANPATIELAPDDWNHTSSIAIVLVVIDNGITAPITATGWFDGITLNYEPYSDVIFANGFEFDPL